MFVGCGYYAVIVIIDDIAVDCTIDNRLLFFYITKWIMFLNITHNRENIVQSITKIIIRKIINIELNIFNTIIFHFLFFLFFLLFSINHFE